MTGKVAVHHDDGSHEEYSFHTCGHCRETVECSPQNDHNPKECKIPADYTCPTCEQTILRGTKFAFGKHYDDCVPYCKNEEDIGVYHHSDHCPHHHHAPMRKRATEAWKKRQKKDEGSEASPASAGPAESTE